jgi:hypothetical protein
MRNAISTKITGKMQHIFLRFAMVNSTSSVSSHNSYETAIQSRNTNLNASHHYIKLQRKIYKVTHTTIPRGALP